MLGKINPSGAACKCGKVTVFVDPDEERLVSLGVPPRHRNLDVVDVGQHHVQFTVFRQRGRQGPVQTIKSPNDTSIQSLRCISFTLHQRYKLFNTRVSFHDVVYTF